MLVNPYIFSAAEEFIEATGGDQTIYDANYKVIIFTSSGTLNVTKAPLGKQLEYVVLGGGGGGGGFGGGGAGRYKTGFLSPVVQSYAITIGSGGLGATTVGGGARGGNGGDSIFDIITAIGGGGGGGFSNTISIHNGADGGCGGGAGSFGLPTFAQGSIGLGEIGNNGGLSDSAATAGGGGGCGYLGADAAAQRGGDGGFGALNSITGVAKYYGGGGGGGGFFSRGLGAVTGGGNGACAGGGDPANAPTSATDYGSGGGGGYPGVYDNAGNGYQGIIIIRYQYQSYLP